MNVLILGVGSHREFGIVSLKQAGHTVGALDSLEKLPVDLLDWFAWVTPNQLRDVKQALEVCDIKWDALLCWDEMSVETAADLSAWLGVPSAKLKPRNFRDKSLMRSVLRENGFAVPLFHAVLSVEEALAKSKSLAYPLIVKPADYGGSSGVRLVHDDHGLMEAVEQALAKSPSRKCVVEEYVVGPEFSVETVTWGRGKHLTFGVTEKQITPPPYFVEVAHTFPALLSEADHTAIISTTHKVLNLFGMEVGASHLELKMTPRGPVVIEVAGRLGGDYISNLVWRSIGMNPYLCELQAIVGHPLPDTPEREGGMASAIGFFVAEKGTTVTWPSLPSLWENSLLREVLCDVKYWYPSGTLAPELNSNSKRLGYCMFHGPRAKVAEALKYVQQFPPTVR